MSGFEEENEEAGEGFNEETGEGFVVDMGGVDENATYPVIPPATYDVEVDDCQFGESQRSGNKMWTMQLKILEGEFAGQKLFYHLVFTEGGMPRVKRFLARGKFEDDAKVKGLLDTKWSPEKIADEGLLLNGRMRAKVTNRKYQGKMRSNVQDILPPQAADQGGFAGA